MKARVQWYRVLTNEKVTLGQIKSEVKKGLKYFYSPKDMKDYINRYVKTNFYYVKKESGRKNEKTSTDSI